jgi:beta-lactam-binding protein with PASTA domain
LPAAGNSVIAVLACRNPVAVSVADNQTGNTYATAIANKDSADGCTASILWLPAVVGHSGTFTVTATLTGVAAPSVLTLLEVSGLSALDQTGSAISSGLNTITTLSATAGAANSQANDFVIACLSTGYQPVGSPTGTSSTPASGYTSAYFADPASTQGVISVGYKFVTAVETSAAAWTCTTAWHGACAALATFTVAAATPTMVTVPNVVGLTDTAARAALTAAGLTTGAVTSAASTSASGIVLSQSPTAAASVTAGSAVALSESVYTPATSGIVQSASIAGPGASIACSFAALPAAGNSVIAVLTGRQPVNVTVADNQTGNTYVTAIANRDGTHGCTATIVWLPAVVGRTGTFTVTATLDAGGGPSVLTLLEVSGLTALDRTGSVSTPGATSLTASGSAANSQASDFVVAALGSGYEGTATGTSNPPASGYTSAYFGDALFITATTYGTNSVAYKFVTAAETSAATWTCSTAWNGACAAIATFKYTGTATTFTVPNVVGLADAAARSTLTAAGLTTGAVTTANSNTVAAGLVISQSPAAGATASSGASVALLESLGPLTAPNVVGMTLAAAEAAITAATLTVGAVTTANSTTIASGLIISQTPAAGAVVTAGSAVAILESLGPLTGINVVGLTLAAAQSALTAEGLVCVPSNSYSNTVAAGLIVSQSPAAGAVVTAGASVAVIVSLGPLLVPNIVGASVSAATAAVVALGLGIAESGTALSATVPVGYIVSQSPAAGATSSSGALVQYVVSLGYAPIPTLTGLTTAAAETALIAAGFTLGTVTAIASAPPAGVVTSFNPTGAQAPGTAVNLIISTPFAINPATSITSKLLDYLHRVFDKNPTPFLALRIACALGGLTWVKGGSTLTLTPAVSGSAAPLVVDLTEYTVTSLAQFVSSQPGYVVPYQDNSPLSALSALVLIDATGDASLTNGDHLYGFTNLLWSYVTALAAELNLAQSEIVNMLLQMSTTTAANEFLDLLGTYYKQPRNVSELDAAYGPRIISNVLLPSSNNVGMQIALQKQFPGTTALVIDAINDEGALLLRDGSIFFNSAHVHNSGGVGDPGGLFDVVFAFNFSGPISEAQYLPLLTAAVNGYRAGGTFLREIRFTDSSGVTPIVPPTLAAPTISPASGTYSGPQTVTITSGISGAIIYYTLDGTTPNGASPVYSGPLTVSASQVVSAFQAVAAVVSPVTSATYNIVASGGGALAAPTISPPAGTYSGAQAITIAGAAGATIYYTLDGTTPNGSSPVYSSLITVGASETVTALQTRGGVVSAVATAVYTITAPPSLAIPTFTPAPGTYAAAQTATITGAVGAVIYYTVDGSVPTVASTRYAGTINVTVSQTLKAVQAQSGVVSPVASAAYTITPLVAPTPAAPTILPAAGTYTTTQVVSITGVSGAVIHYTLDGTTPTAASPIYSGTLNVAASETVNALQILSGVVSPVASAAYTLVSSGGGTGATLAFGFPNFSGNLSALSIGGQSAVQSNGEIQLDWPDGRHDSACMWSANVQPNGAWMSTFTFRFGLTGSGTAGVAGTPAAGVVSSINTVGVFGIGYGMQNSTTPPASSQYGRFSGNLAHADSNCAGIGCYSTQAGTATVQGATLGPSLMLKFDGNHLDSAASNVAQGTQPNSTGLYTYGGPWGGLSPSQDLNPYGINFYNGNEVQATVVYDGSVLTTVLKDLTTGAQARFEYMNVNIAACNAGATQSYVGFTHGSALENYGAPVYIANWYHYNGYYTRLATPTFSLAPGQYSGSQSVTINHSPGASVYYTTNGLLPTSAATLYTGAPITITKNTHLQAVAIQSGFTDSYTGKALYKISTASAISLASGFGAGDGVTVLGYAYRNGTAIQLLDQVATPAARSAAGAGSQQSNAWFSSPVNITASAAAPWTTTFTFTASGGANGFTFIIQNPTAVASVLNTQGQNGNQGGWQGCNGPFAMGFSGDSLGYGGNGGGGGPPLVTGGGLFNSLAIKADVYGGNTTGLYTNGATPGQNGGTALSPVNLTSGNQITVTLHYDGTTLIVTFTDTVTGATKTNTYAVNIPAIVGGNTAYVGFGAGSGGQTLNLKLLAWTFTEGTGGPSTATVPNVVGITDTAARAAITAVSLTVGAVTTSPSTQATGTVLSQSPAAGVSVAAGSSVALVESVYTSSGGGGGGSGTGLYVSNGRLNNPDGTEFRIRGINRLHWGSYPWAGGANGALVKPNAVRVFAYGDFPTLLGVLQNDHVANQEIVIPCINYINGVYTSGDNSATDLTACVNQWISVAPTWAPVLNPYGILNIANEFYSASNPVTWGNAYASAVAALRPYYTCPFLIDAGNYGQSSSDIISAAAQVLAADPAHNTAFSFHAYNATTPSNVASLFASLAALRSSGICVVIGEFGPGLSIGPSPTLLTPTTCINTAEANNLGWMPWCWDDNDLANGASDDNFFSFTYAGPGYYTGLASQLTNYGKTVVPLIQSLAVKSTIFGS